MFCSSVSSLRLAYRDLDIKTKEKLNLSGRKKNEFERLGMGFGSNRRYVKFYKLFKMLFGFMQIFLILIGK